MADIYDAIAAVGLELPPVWADVLARALERSSGPQDWQRIIADLDDGQDHPSLDRLGQAWSAEPTIAPQALAVAIRATARSATASIASQQIELVWTGPATTFIPMRRTEQVVQQVVDSATRRLWITSYVFVNPEGIAPNLKAAAERGVEIIAILESPKTRGGAIDHDPAGNLALIVPSARIHEWTPNAKRKAGWSSSGCVHSKTIVADTVLAFVTSANLTGSAMDRNMEMGVLVRGGPMPMKIGRHLDALVSMKVVDPYAPQGCD